MTKKLEKKIKINIDPKIFNEIYLKEKILEDTSRYLILYGGAGSGKSVVAAQKILLRCMKESGHRFLCVRKVGKTLRNSIFALFKDVISNWGLMKYFTINKTDMTITFINGSQIILVGLDDQEKIKSIAGISGVWLEETSEFLKQDFDQLDLRLRGKTVSYKQIILSFNPISDQSWLKKEFFDTKHDNAKILKTTYLDNKFIDDEYKQTLERLKETNPEFYKIYALGEFGVSQGLIFSNWSVEEFEWKHFDKVSSGMDFGFNDPSTFIQSYHKDNVLYVFNEFYQTELTNSELITEIKKIADLKTLIYGDSAEPDRIKQFKQAGFRNIRGADKGAGSIKSGIDHLKQFKILVHPDCVNLIRELQNYQYVKDKKSGEFLDTPLANGNDHVIDALRYSIQNLGKVKKLKATKGF